MELPLVLAGPILRRVEPRAVVVWVALSKPATVTLSLWEGIRKSGTSAKAISVSAPTPARRIGEQLHVALLVVRRPAPAVALQPGVNYAYDLAFDLGASQGKRSLASEGLLGAFAAAALPAGAWVSEAPLGYAAGLLPSFALPPGQLTDLRVLYGSCRRVANGHYDAMPWIDTLIDQSFTGQTRQEGDPLGAAALKRPHQLYLGGDQIYADDLSALHLVLLNRLGHQMLSGSVTPGPSKVETLQASGKRAAGASADLVRDSLLIGRPPERHDGALDLSSTAFPATLDVFPAGGRLELTQADARFTSSDGSSHLLSFGEFAAMYVSVYADWCWSGLPALSLDEVARGPATPTPQAVPMYARTRLDDAAVAYFNADRWVAWNKIRPRVDPDTRVLGPANKRRFADCFAHFMLQRLAQPGSLAGFDDFLALISHPDSLLVLDAEQRAELDPDVGRAMEDLARKHAVVVQTFMRQLQARVMRTLVRQFGIGRVADVDCQLPAGSGARVLLAGPTTILAELRRREKEHDEGREDVWCAHLQDIVPASQWIPFLRNSLRETPNQPWLAPEVPSLGDVQVPEPKDVTDAELPPAVLERLLAHWTTDPEPGERKKWKDLGYTDLSQHAIARCLADFAGKHVWKVWSGLHGELAELKRFAAGQAKVRRALANVPTYMVFDDHDVTDDWNLNPLWCQRVLAADAVRTQPLGRQVIRNALAAYALFQDWGNDLVRYESGTTGAQVLQQIGRLFGATAPWPLAAATRELDRLFGLDQLPQPVDATRPTGRHAPVNAPMKWHYTVDGPNFFVAVLDNRTRRSFASRLGPPGNVAATMIDDQVPAAPLPAGRELLLVIAPLQVIAPSVFDEVVAPAVYRAKDLGAPGHIGSGRGGEAMPGLDPDAIEGWAMDPPTFEALTARLAPHRKVLLLSGDVHYSSATQMSYWRRGEAQPSRLLQFTSSGIKNVMPSYITVIDHCLAFAQELVRSDIGGDRLGWLAGAEGAFTFPAGKSEHDVPLVLRKRIAQRPAYLPTYGWPAGTKVRSDKRPDFSWTLRPVFDVRPDGTPPAGTTPRPAMAQPAVIAGTPPGRGPLEAGGASARDAYAQIAARHVRQLDRLSHSRQLLFRSNFGQVRFARRTVGSGTAQRELLEAVHQVIGALPDPLDGHEQPHLLPPEVVMEQRAELTPPAGEVRPEDAPLKSPLGESLVDKLRSLGS